MRRAFWLFLLGFFGFTLSTFSAGLIIVHDEDFWRRAPAPWQPSPPSQPPRDGVRFLPPPPAWAPLETTFTKAAVVIKDQFATTSIEQEFYNPNPRQLEGTFLFPVPKGAQINKFTMEINGKTVEAELLAADKARGIYEDIVRKLRDPALLEYSGRDLFKVRIFPIEANARKRITLSYSQILKADSGLVNFAFPLNTEKFSARPIKTVSIKVDVETRRPLKSIYSPSHNVEIKRNGGNKATIGYEASDVKPDTDFQLFYSQEDGDLGVSLLTYKTAGDDGYFVLLAAPGSEMKQGKVFPKDVLFVLDTSGSMAGAKLEQAKKALTFCIENLNDGDRFELLRFATEVEPMFDRLNDATRENRARAQKFITGLRPLGGTAIDEALKKALSMRPEKGDRPYVVIFLTDGRPTVGNTVEDQIVDTVKKAGGGNVRIFCFGIGTDVNTHLLDKITEETRAYSTYVLPEEDIEVKVSSFFTKVKDPVLASPKLFFPENVRVTKLYPSPVPDVFKGEQIVLAGRYSGKGDGAIRIEGSMNAETKTFAYDVKFAGESNDHEFIPRLWATRRVGYLLDEIRLRGESKELKDEVTELARKYSIVTPYTAYLIQEDEKSRGIAQNVRTMSIDRFGVDGREAEVFFREQNRATDGGAAVSGARSSFHLKSATSAGDAILAGGAESLRAERSLMPPASAPMARASRNGGGWAADVTRLTETPATIRTDAAKKLAEQGRFVGGKTFFQNQDKWVDSELQKKTPATRVRLSIGSPEYFDLLRKHPQTTQWLALGSKIEFLLDNTIYEIE
ncbi:MAG: Ca-activated chloride channel [Verrucomicrobiota bacterium]|jgi:Ca-activated chloride channel family protein